MKKEMSKAQVAYEEVEGVTPEEVRANKVPELRSFQEISCHIIFDVDYKRKTRLLQGGVCFENFRDSERFVQVRIKIEGTVYSPNALACYLDHTLRGPFKSC